MKESILAAAVAATQAAVQAEAATAHQATPIDTAEVEALVSTLPDRAKDGKAGDALATSFIFAEWDPRDHRKAEVAGAALERLTALGLTPAVETVKIGLRQIPGRIVVDYADLEAAAAKEAAARSSWIGEASVLWLQVGGEGAEVREVVARSGRTVARFSTRALAVPVNDATPFRIDFLLRNREREVEIDAYWLREVDEAVAFVEGAIRPVRWTVAGLEAAWAPHGFVSYSYGLYEGGQLRQCAVIEFRRGDQTHKVAVEDVRSYKAEDLAAKVASEGAWEAMPGAGAPAMPDRVDARIVAGDARDRELGIKQHPGQRDEFKYVAPPGPPRIHLGDDAPIPMPGDAPKSHEALPAGAPDPHRMTPTQAVLTDRPRAAKAAKKAAPPAAGGRTRKAAAGT
jgi:hypothetical protein